MQPICKILCDWSLRVLQRDGYSDTVFNIAKSIKATVRFNMAVSQFGETEKGSRRKRILKKLTFVFHETGMKKKQSSILSPGTNVQKRVIQ